MKFNEDKIVKIFLYNIQAITLLFISDALYTEIRSQYGISGRYVGGLALFPSLIPASLITALYFETWIILRNPRSLRRKSKLKTLGYIIYYGSILYVAYLPVLLILKIKGVY